MGRPPQAVIVKANPYDTRVKITQRNSGKVNITYVRSKEGVWTRIERGVRLVDVVQVSNDLVAMTIFLAEPDIEVSDETGAKVFRALGMPIFEGSIGT